MAALDRAGVSSRLDAAKDEVATLIDSLLPGRQLCLISSSGSARKLTGFTDNKRVLHAALAGIETEEVAGELDEALRLARALSRTEPFDRVLLLSDGVFQADSHVDLPFTLEYQRLDPAGSNLGITSLNARRSAGGDWSLFSVIEGRGAEGRDQVATLELSLQGEMLVREHLTLEPGASERLVVTLPGDTHGTITLRLIPVGFDALAADNLAFLELIPARPLQVLVSSSLPAFQHALSALPEVVHEDETGASGDRSHDLVITDREDLLESAGREAVAALTVGLVPSDLASAITIDQQGSAVIDWQRGGLLQHVELDDLIILDRPQLADGIDEGWLERLGYEVLISGNSGPLLLSRRSHERRDYHLLFHPDRSTLPYRIGFPILLSNLVHEAARRAGLSERAAVRTGILPPLALAPEQEYLVRGPDGGELRGRAGAGGELTGMPATRVGEHRIIRSDGTEVAIVATSLLDSTETRLAGVDEIDLPELAVTVAESPVEVDRPLWPWLVLLGLAVALLEWWLFHRRPGGAIG
jgi:hypothetical protein